MRRILAAFFIVALLWVPARADRYFVATAYDTEGFESGFSNEVHATEFFTLGVTFAWTPNLEPDIDGYKFHVRSQIGWEYETINIEIKHLDYCNTTTCERTLSIEPITTIYLKESAP